MKKLLFILMIFFSTLSADTELGGLINTANTKASDWTSPVTGEHYYYSGSYNFTFNTTKSYAPWFNVGAPGLSIGCAGISLKGGFLSLLGLNEIKDQLSNAGAQLAWGVMIGLVYSMPGIGDVFMKIQKWARAIQALLANACNIGQAFGEKLAKNLYNSDTAKEDAQSWLNNKMSGVTGALDNLSKWTDNLNSCLSSASSIDFTNGCAAKSNQPKGPEVSKIGFKIVGKSITNNIVNSRLNLTTSPDNKIYMGTLKELVDNGQVNGKSVATLSDNDKSTLELNLLFFGDKALPAKQATQLVEHTDCSGIEKNKICKPQIDKGKLANETEGIPLPKNYTPTNIGPILKPLQAAQALLHGFSSQTNPTNCFDNGYCNIPNYITMYVNITGKQNSDGGTAKPIQFFTITSVDSNDPKIAVHWKGAIQESLEKIRAYVKDNSGVEPTIPSTDETAANVNKDSIIPLFVPGVGKYIKIIGKIEKKSKKETIFTASLKEMLAKYNAFLFAKYLISMEEARILAAATGDNSSSSGGSTEEQIKQLRQIKAEIQKELDGILKENNYFKDVADIFKEIDKDYRKDITKNF